MWFVTFVCKNLARRPLRSFLTIIAIAIAIGSFITLVGIATGFEHSFLQIYSSSGVDIIVVRTGPQQRLTSVLPARLGAEIKKLPGVKEVIGGLAEVVAFGENGEFKAIINGWEPETAAFDHLRIVAGTNLTRNDQRGVLLGTILADNIAKKVGDSVEILEKEPFRVVGIYETSNVLENGAMVIPLKEMQRLFDRQGMVTGFSLIMEQDKKEPAAIAQTCARIGQLAPGLKALDKRDFVNSTTEIRLAKGMAWLTSLIALLIGTFGIMNTMVMSIHERTREIGTLRAVGWRKGRVMRMILTEALLLSLLGAAAGTLASLVLLNVLTRVPLVNGFVDGRLPPLLVLEGFLIALAVGVVGGMLPARRAARLLPVTALRHE
jgi:putative ABC transport system permease protein